MKLKQSAAAVALLAMAAGACAQDVVVKIGHSGPLSGAQAFSGKDNENGARLAVEELNAKPITVGGKKLKFELMSEDDQGDPKAGVSAAQNWPMPASNTWSARTTPASPSRPRASTTKLAP
jgi:ABC-type branched-subunit amino acid transport system substrate-binding protein